jgi:multiphosphoryl transfer protein
MVGIVIVSHSLRIAEGVAELAREMGGPDVRLETAGGLDLPDHPIGTDAVMVQEAIERAWSDDGVLVLMDLGSAVLSAEMALDLIVEEHRANVLLCEAPLVEGAVAAAVTAKSGGTLDAVAAEARGGLAGKIAHLDAGSIPTTVDDVTMDRDAVSIRLTVRNPHGLHARPAARFVQAVAPFDARVSVRDLTNDRGPADAMSLNAVAILGVAAGHEIEVSASGPDAARALAAVGALAGRDFDDPSEVESEAPTAPPETEPTGEGVPGVLRGFAASPGVAAGPARRLHLRELDVPEGTAADAAEEVAALDAALALAADDVRRQREQVAARVGEAQAEIFDAHLLFLRDEALVTPARRAIREDDRTAAQAWHDSVDATAAGWMDVEDPYLRGRVDDLWSVGAQVLAHILGEQPATRAMTNRGILVSEDLSPADTANLDPSVVLGIATVHGGPTSHAAVIARSLGIPAVVGIGDSLEGVDEGTSLVLDGGAGEVHVDPPPAVVDRLLSSGRRRNAAIEEARAAARTPAVTVDGTAVEVSANVGSAREVAAAISSGADGVGLFRTELLFMGRDTMPDEDEQEAEYRAAAEACDGRPLLIRTLDAGADKPIPYLHQTPESNAFLGVRGIRLSLERPDLLETQLRAILRVAADHPLRAMFPMVATIDELRRATAVLDDARSALGSDAPLEIGIMIEVPASALTAVAFAAEVSFFSIGTNDLTQYTLAADRGNERVAGLTDALHPAVLRLIHATVEGARTHGRWVGVCGELAGEAAASQLLLGLGVTELSMSAPAIAEVKQAIRSIDLAAARELAEHAFGCASAAEVRGLLFADRGGAVTMPPTP